LDLKRVKGKSSIDNRQSSIGNLDVVCLGEILIDLVPSPALSPLGKARHLRIAPGGAPANVAVALRRLGLSSGFIGKAGDDPFGRFLRDALTRQKLDLSLFELTAAAQTRLAFVTNDSNERQRFIFYGNPGADVLLQSEEIEENYLRRAQIFHFGSISLIQEPARSATVAAIRLARKNGLIVSFDPNLRPALWPSLKHAHREILKALSYCHILKVNRPEWEFLFPGKRFEEGFSLLRRRGIRLAAVTLGPNGAILASHRSRVKVGSPPVRTVDTTGTGDGFVAGLLYGVLKHENHELQFGDTELREMGRLATCIGAMTATKPGAIPAFPSLRQVRAFMKKSKI
jgi:sugar/nucleoside kinase (ribokinase family)